MSTQNLPTFVNTPPATRLVTPANTSTIKPAPVRSNEFYVQAGYNAQRLGLSSFDSPYKGGDPRNRLWMSGYADAKRLHAKPLEVSDGSRPHSKVAVQPAPAKPLVRHAQRFSTRKKPTRGQS